MGLEPEVWLKQEVVPAAILPSPRTLPKLLAKRGDLRADQREQDERPYERRNHVPEPAKAIRLSRTQHLVFSKDARKHDADYEMPEIKL